MIQSYIFIMKSYNVWLAIVNNISSIVCPSKHQKVILINTRSESKAVETMFNKILNTQLPCVSDHRGVINLIDPTWLIYK